MSSLHSVTDDSLQDIELELGYSTGSDDLINRFYIPCLNAASRYDRAVGYFRSTLFAITGVALSDFASRGGAMRLVCSPHLRTADMEAINRGYEIRDILEQRLIWEINEVVQYPENQPVLRLLASLIAIGAMEIRLAFRLDSKGLFHSKIGIFRDEDTAVSFIGSSNESFMAWDSLGNHEAFEVFTSWMGDSERVRRHIDYFERLWESDEPGVRTYEFPEPAKEMLSEFADQRGLEYPIDDVRREYEMLAGLGEPRVSIRTPSRRVLMNHQNEVIDNWVASDYRGIIDHATGSGKTIAALEGINRWVSRNRPAVVFVPSTILAQQWMNEARTQLDIDTAYLEAGAGASRNRWITALGDFSRDLDALGPRLTVATMQTASRDAFLERIQGGDHLLVVADEVHKVGSSMHRLLLSIEAGGRLGLSATPERFGDPDGTEAILNYFGDVLPPEFGIREALVAGRLVPYDYFVETVALTISEQSDWDEITERIQSEYARLPEDAGGRKIHTEGFKLLLIRRSWITKQADNKTWKALEVVAANYRSGDRWIIYCDDQSQLGEVLLGLREAGFEANEYHSQMRGARDVTLEYFQERGGILVAIRCLDEGVDIPLVDNALILASSSNQREFIQRRGRVLRTAPGKYSATVRDLIVTPSTEIAADDPQASIIRTELRRARVFAENARNESVRHELDIIERRYGLQHVASIAIDFEPEIQRDSSDD